MYYESTKRCTTMKFLVISLDIAQFIHVVEIFKERVEISNESIRYNPDVDKFVCDIYFYEVKDAVLFQNIFVTFFKSSKYVEDSYV